MYYYTQTKGSNGRFFLPVQHKSLEDAVKACNNINALGYETKVKITRLPIKRHY